MLAETIVTHVLTRQARPYFRLKPVKESVLFKPDRHGKYLLYIHIPFCENICTYCSFFKVKYSKGQAVSYFKALKKELSLIKKLGFSFDDLYIGGGTPTVLPEALFSLLDFIRSLWALKQVSVETIPHHLTGDNLKRLKECGVNRLSVGVQTFNKGFLDRFNRWMNKSDMEEVKIKIKGACGIFDTLNVDMIFNFQNQTLSMLDAEINILKELPLDQITYYPLMYNGNLLKFTPRGYSRREKRLYRYITEKLSPEYSMTTPWNFSRNHHGMIDEYIITHDEYVGIGAGSFSYFNGHFFTHTFSIDDYIKRVNESVIPLAGYGFFNKKARIKYDLLIRLFSGMLDKTEMKRKYGRFFLLYIWKELLFLLLLRTITIRGGRIYSAARGNYLFLLLMRHFFSFVNYFRELSKKLSH
ncbi:MAG: coproporphyrinogen III oxidase family protein [Spirochaetales bacterium]|nr:coproporphyrinogen III oxidase family protein [Spirochaetales bacterium]